MTALASVVALSATAFGAQAQTQTESKGLFGYKSPLDTIGERSEKKSKSASQSATRDAKKKKKRQRSSSSIPRGSFY